MSKSAIAIWRRMMGYLGPYKRWASIAFIGIIGSNILMITVPMVLRDVIDIGISNRDSDYMLQAGILVVGLGVLRGITGFMYRFFGERLSHHISYDIRSEIYDKVQTLQFAYHDNAQVGTLITRAISDVNEIQRYFAFGLIDGINTFLLFTGVAIVMFASSPLLAAIALLPLIPLALFSRKFVLNIHPRWRQIMERTQKLSNQLQENALGAQVVRAFAREKHEIENFSKHNENLYHEQLGFIKEWARYLPISAFIAATSTALVLIFGGFMVDQGVGNVTVGLVVSFNAYVLQLAQPMRFLGFVILLTTQAIASSERVFEITDTPVTITNKGNAVKPDHFAGHVRFENVGFAYPGTKHQVLKNISLQAKPGQVTALLGPTGSGKTTLVNLIPRFYEATTGSVTIDEVDVRDLDLHTLRQNIGVVLQESLLFSASIHDNIAYGRPDATREQVIAAAQAANAHDFIIEFQEGYETLVGERGITLSGGQRQRVAIARALLVDPRILILDDATSSVDTKTENLIQQALDNLMKGRTTFVIAQRLSTVLNAEQILVLDGGEVAEQGTHEELLQQEGLYTEIYRLQLQEQERVRRESHLFEGRLNLDEEESEVYNTLFNRMSGGK